MLCYAIPSLCCAMLCCAFLLCVMLCCLMLEVANGNCETLRDSETSVFLCEPETFELFRLQDRDFKVFSVRVRDVRQTLKIQAPYLGESYENELE